MYHGLECYHGKWGKQIMNKITKIFFWTLTILLGFVNPLISIVLIVLYYLPKIILDLEQQCDKHVDSGMNSFSEDVMEEMK